MKFLIDEGIVEPYLFGAPIIYKNNNLTKFVLINEDSKLYEYFLSSLDSLSLYWE